MKTTTNKKELKELNACSLGYKVFIEAHGNKDVKLSECIDSNGWEDVWWLINKAYNQLTDDQKYDLRVFGCKKALINIEKIKPYCSAGEYVLINNYLINPKESARSLAWSAAESAAWSAGSARSAAWSAAWSAAESAAESAARSAAWSAAWLAAESAAWSARSAAESLAWSLAWSAAESAAESTARSAWSTAINDFTEELKQLFIEWESKQ